MLFQSVRQDMKEVLHQQTVPSVRKITIPLVKELNVKNVQTILTPIVQEAWDFPNAVCISTVRPA